MNKRHDANERPRADGYSGKALRCSSAATSASAPRPQALPAEH